MHTTLQSRRQCYYNYSKCKIFSITMIISWWISNAQFLNFFLFVFYTNCKMPSLISLAWITFLIMIRFNHTKTVWMKKISTLNELKKSQNQPWSIFVLVKESTLRRIGWWIDQIVICSDDKVIETKMSHVTLHYCIMAKRNYSVTNCFCR